MQIKCKYKETRAWEEKSKIGHWVNKTQDVSYICILITCTFFTSFKNQKVSIVIKKSNNICIQVSRIQYAMGLEIYINLQHFINF